MAEAPKKTYLFIGELFRELMGKLEFTFVSSATSNKNRDGSFNGTISRYQEEVAQLKVYLNEFNSENADRVMVETNYPAVVDVLKEMEIKPQRIGFESQKKPEGHKKLGRK